jgi:hypothetical protein
MKMAQLVQRLQDRIANPGAEEGTEADDDFLHFLNGIIRRTPSGFVITSIASEVFTKPQLATVEHIIQGFDKALAQHTAALQKDVTGNLAPVFGPEAGERASAARTSDYVQVKTYWYGFKVYMTHSCVSDVTKAGAGAAAILTAGGVSALISGLVVAVVGTLAGFDRGQGVTLSFLWPGALVWIRSGQQL